MRLEIPEENVRVPLAEFQAVWTRAESLPLGWKTPAEALNEQRLAGQVHRPDGAPVGPAQMPRVEAARPAAPCSPQSGPIGLHDPTRR